MLLLLSMAIPFAFIGVAVAVAPSTGVPQLPFPATVVITPSVAIFLIL